jgi:NAD(P)-dependent dehydrogenase (short-subunit alcohol dehydrogenase family)
MARVLAGAGARVSAGARRVERLTELTVEITAAGGEARAVPLDVTDAASITQAMAVTQAAFGPLNILINNAGISRSDRAETMAMADWDAVMETNLRGVFAVAQAAARGMKDSGGGSIINIASILGERVAGGVAAYAVSKAGVVQMTKALALEWARHGIRVNAIAPGYMETEMNEGFFATDAGAALIKRIPQRRLGEPRELDGPLLLLASDAASYMTGSVIPVDGGHLVSSL